MWLQFLQTSGLVLVMTTLILVSMAGVVLVAFQLPGTWVIVIATGLTAIFYSDTIGWWTFGALVAIAVVGEVVEFLAGSIGARRAGGSKRGAWLAILTSILGALAGTVLIPIPVLGTIAGACVGALLGAMGGDRWAGREWREAFAAGKGAAWGRLIGTIAKIALATIMWVVVTVAVFV